MQNIRRDALTELSTMPRRFPPPWSIDTGGYWRSGVRAFVKQPVAVISRHKLLIAVFARRYDARRGLASKNRIFGVAERAAEVCNW